VLVRGDANCYDGAMPSLFARRLLVSLLSFALLLGLSAHVVKATHADLVGTLAVAMDTPNSEQGGCDGCCDDQNALSIAACAAFCSGMVALTVEFVEIDAMPASAHHELAGPSVTSRTISPDPHPPRATS
jgi:hypothetical protein